MPVQWNPLGGPSPVTLTGLTAPLDFAKVSAAATAYMDKSEKENAAAIAADGVGLRYGETSSYAKLKPAQRFTYVQNIVKQKNPARANDTAYINSLMARMRSTSCIGYTMEGLATGYAAAGQSGRWAEIQGIVRSKGTIGTVLMSEMQKDGWEAVYWNADTHTYRGPRNTSNDIQRMKDHNFFISKFMGPNGNTFRTGADYYGTTPSHALVNFFAAPAGSNPAADPTQLAHLKNVPYWVGVAASGYHTFPGNGLNVRDSHVARDPDDLTNIENRPFQNLDYAWDVAARRRKTTPTGAPMYSEEQSGIMLIPPGTWTE